MDWNTAKCYGGDRIDTPVTGVSSQVPYPTERYARQLIMQLRSQYDKLIELTSGRNLKGHLIEVRLITEKYRYTWLWQYPTSVKKWQHRLDRFTVYLFLLHNILWDLNNKSISIVGQLTKNITLINSYNTCEWGEVRSCRKSKTNCPHLKFT